MCLLLLSYRAHPEVELLLGGNRDEFLARPSAPPQRIWEHPRIYAGRDLEAGGTWIGRNEHGLIAALTNIRPDAKLDPAGFRSRGTIVLELLKHAEPEAAAQWLTTLPLEAYRPFNVLVGNGARFYCFSSADGAPPRELPPGTYVLSNSSLDDRNWPKVQRAHAFLETVRGLPGETLIEAVQAFLLDPPPTGRSRDEATPMEAVFVSVAGYGTVSSTILCAGGPLGDRYYYAERPAMLGAREGWAAYPPEGVPLPTGEGNPYRRLSFAD